MRVEEVARRVSDAKKQIGLMNTQRKNAALRSIGMAIDKNRKVILEKNEMDVHAAMESGISDSIVDRLLLNDKRIDSMIESINKVIDLDDPVGKIDDGWVLPNGLQIKKVRVPIGAIGMIYEGRPNVTVDSTILCLKSGNSVLLKGSASAQNSNAALVEIIKSALEAVYFPQSAVELVEETSHDAVSEMIKMRKYLDLVIPRGGKSLIDFVVQNATVPTLETGKATEEDWSTEYLDLILGIKIVKDVDEAIEHISKYGTKHSESIITKNYDNALKFTHSIDAAAVYVNASTRFTDGGEFGFGAEIGISTQKLHARGPVGLNELTSYKYVIYGEGQVRS